MSRTLTNRNQWENLTDNFQNLHNVLIQFHLLSLNIPVLDVRMLGGIRTGIRITFMVTSLRLASTGVLMLMEISAPKRL